MNTTVEHWFTLKMIHDYFDKSTCTVLQLEAMIESTRLMKNYKIRLRKQANEYRGYVETKGIGDMINSLPLEQDLFFMVIPTDVYFSSYTKEALSKEEDTLLYFTNDGDGNTTPLSIARRAIKTLRFTAEVPMTAAVKVSIKNATGVEIVQQTTLKGQQQMPINLEAFGTGLYQLWINDELKTTFLGTSDTIPLNCYGILHLQMKPLGTILRNNALPQLEMVFEAKKVFWQYAVIVPSDKKITIKNLNVIGSDGTIYSGPEQKKIGQQEAAVFTSLVALSLRQKINTPPILRMQYTNDFSSTLLDMDIKMPLPSISNMNTIEESQGKKSYSQAIVYV